MIDIEANKQKFIQIFKGEVHREGADALLNWLETNSDFFTMPHTGQRVLSCKGGACQHALNTFMIMTDMVAKYREKDPNFLLSLEGNESQEQIDEAIADLDQSIAICSLLHDIGNTNCWFESTKNVQQPDGRWLKQPCWRWEEDFIYDHGGKSVFIISQFMRLYLEEAQAIRFHMQGKNVPYNDQIETTYYDAYDQNLFACVLGAAVNEATNVADRILSDKLKAELLG